MINIRKEVGRKIKALRENYALTQEKLAEAIGVQTQVISKLETGKSFISYRVLEKLCDIYDLKPKYFFDYNEIQHNSSAESKIKVINDKINSLTPERLDDIYKIVTALSI